MQVILAVLRAPQVLLHFHHYYTTYLPIGADQGKNNQCHFGVPNICTEFRGGAKNQPMPWHSGTTEYGNFFQEKFET